MAALLTSSPAPHTGPMARRITETFYGHSMPDVWIEVEGVEYHGELRAWAVDEDPATNQGDEWWAMCN